MKDSGEMEVYPLSEADDLVCTGSFATVTLDNSGSCNFSDILQFYTITTSPDPLYNTISQTIGCSTYDNVGLFLFIGLFIIVIAVIVVIAYKKCTCTKKPYEAMHTSIDIDDETNY